MAARVGGSVEGGPDGQADNVLDGAAGDSARTPPNAPSSRNDKDGEHGSDPLAALKKELGLRRSKRRNDEESSSRPSKQRKSSVHPSASEEAPPPRSKSAGGGAPAPPTSAGQRNGQGSAPDAPNDEEDPNFDAAWDNLRNLLDSEDIETLKERAAKRASTRKSVPIAWSLRTCTNTSEPE